MLVLVRKRGESIDIGDDIVVTVVEILFGKVRIGISAPKDVPINRREITNLLASQDDEGDWE